MRHKKIIFACALSVLSAGQGIAFDMSDEGYSKGAASYLDIGAYAKASAMAKAYTSLARGAGDFCYNPAGLAKTPAMEFSTTSAVLEMDRSLFYSGFVYPFRTKTEDVPEVFEKPVNWTNKIFSRKDYNQTGVGVAFMDFGVSDIEGRDEWGVETSEFSDRERMLLLGAGYKIYKNLSAGMNVKYLTQKLEKSTAEGFGLDFGMLYSLKNEKISFGFAARDLFSELEWEINHKVLDKKYCYKENVPEKYVLGSSYGMCNDKLIVALDLNKTQGVKLRPQIGVEYKFISMLMLRAGIDHYQPSLGWGLNLAPGNLVNMSLDYAFKYDMDGLANTHFFSLDVVLRPKGEKSHVQ